MKYEVEQKFAVEDAIEFEERLKNFGQSLGRAEEHHDTYYSHPARDFGETDEALRIRSIGEKRCITYKGPKIDKSTKTRLEIEVPLPPKQPMNTEDFHHILGALGFKAILDVHKTRRLTRLVREKFHFAISLDSVVGLGTFVEIETIAEEGDVPFARIAMHGIADDLGLHKPERRSYLEMLLNGSD